MPRCNETWTYCARCFRLKAMKMNSFLDTMSKICRNSSSLRNAIINWISFSNRMKCVKLMTSKKKVARMKFAKTLKIPILVSQLHNTKLAQCIRKNCWKNSRISKSISKLILGSEIIKISSEGIRCPKRIWRCSTPFWSTFNKHTPKV